MLDGDDDPTVHVVVMMGVGEYRLGNAGGATFCIRSSSSSFSSHGLLLVNTFGLISSPRAIVYNKLAVIFLVYRFETKGRRGGNWDVRLVAWLLA